MSRPVTSLATQADEQAAIQKEMDEAKPAKKKAKCIVPDCTNKTTCRGMCSKCYSSACSLIKSGKASWEELEKLGLAVSSKRDTTPNKLCGALLDRRTSIKG